MKKNFIISTGKRERLSDVKKGKNYEEAERYDNELLLVKESIYLIIFWNVERTILRSA